ncbi:MAG: hypothetical protein ABEI86_03365 [Halobacteriaceae archaeon]
MPKDKLVPYWVRLRCKNKPGVPVDESKYFDLTSLPDPNGGFENYNSFIGVLHHTLRHFRDAGYVDDDREQTLTLRQLKVDNSGSGSCCTFEGVLGQGDFGRSADHLDISDLQQNDLPPSQARQPNARDRDTAEVSRVYFIFHVPDGKPSRGVLILHAWGRTRIKGLIYRSLQIPLYDDYMESPSEDDRGLQFSINPIASKDIVERLTEVTIHGFELVKRNTPTSHYGSQSDILGGANDAKARFTIDTDTEIALDEEQASTLISKIQDSDYPYAEIFPNSGGDIDKIQAHINAEGSNKLNLQRDKVRMEKIINDDIEYDSYTYRPEMSSVGEAAREFVNDQLEEYDLDLLDTQSLLD